MWIAHKNLREGLEIMKTTLTTTTQTRALELVLTIAIIITATPFARAQEIASRQITTSGQAEVRVVPDEVVLTLGIETMDKNLAESKRLNDVRAQAVLALAKAFAIAPENVQTDHLDIEPRYTSAHAQSELIGYFVRKTVVFTLKDVSKVDALTSAALEAGANYVHGIDFRTTELRKHRDEARAMAIRAARDKAVALAAELEQGIGKPRNISEGYAGWQYGRGGWGGYGNNGWMSAQNTSSSVGSASDSENGIALGQISVSANVSVTFDLE